ncbi:Muscular LMNA-interacting protein [Bagarius yarrelli]|uniref:Muscular LMNA-interacting protein n=1 Tax=Bagarius yarrelli TaxID=175774 RepID=A0A556U735_BAGYA|nr:Muscular LMNA-interacting protein [Bagarius yarrelli]
MALEPSRGALGKVSVVFATKLKSFTFRPVSKKLPTEKRVKPVWEKGSSKLSEALEDHGAPEGKTTDECIYKAEVVYISDTKPQEISEHSETQTHKFTAKSAVAPQFTKAVADAETSCTSPKTYTGTLDKTDNKHALTPQLVCHTIGADINSSQSQREEEVFSPVSSVDIFTSPFSSRESILSEGWEQETGWSAFQTLSPRGSVSPCSSVRSGAFTPSVMRIKCHKLAPASSLMQMPLTSCHTHDCNRHIASPCPLSTHARHRPPPTHLSLLTAILRKGRLPVLSSALKRPYSPCWPISPVNVSSCMACSAASNIAPIVGQRAKSCVSKSTTCTESSCKARPKTAKTEPVLHIDQNREEEIIDVNVSTIYEARSRISPTTKGRSSLTLSSYSPLVSPPANLSKPTNKGIHDSTEINLLLGTSSYRPVSFSPESKLDFQIHRNGHKSHEPSPVWNIRNTNPYQTTSSDLKCMQVAHKRSPTPDPVPSQLSQDSLTSAVPKHTVVRPGSHLHKDELEKSHSSLIFQHPPSPSVAGLTHFSNTHSVSPVVSSPRPVSCTSTSDRNTLSSSPVISYRHFSPSPSYSFCSSPTSSLRNFSPDHMDRGSKKPYKIKSTYKALAAIPTNTLLLEQQAIDDEVIKKDAPLDPGDSFAWEDPHSQLYSPSQLRQQSSELYQVIDEVLKDTKRAEASSPATVLTMMSETTQATFYHQPPDPAEKTLAAEYEWDMQKFQRKKRKDNSRSRTLMSIMLEGQEESQQEKCVGIWQ